MISEPLDRSTPFLGTPLDLLDYVDIMRIDAGHRQRRKRKLEFGQFFTSTPVARLMASMLTCSTPTIRILDAGAGVGSLFAAAVAYFCGTARRPERISVTAYEIDENLFEYLQDTMHSCQELCERFHISFTGKIEQKDFLQSGIEHLAPTLFSSEEHPQFDCAILNPPYKKIQTKSLERKLLQQLGIETSNLYAGFLAIATRFLAPSGELVAITPRSFCNGPYFRHFRGEFLKTMSLRRLHVFDARDRAFSDDNVLQENIILHAQKEKQKPEEVLITSSASTDDELILTNKVAYTQVVHPNDPQIFIHIVQDDLSHHVAKQMAQFHTALANLELDVSTGRVVDFRAEQFLRPEPESDTVPLLYPGNVHFGSITWPRPQTKKPQALVQADQTHALLIPNECYVVVKRFSSKEEKRRVVAALYNPEQIATSYVGFENHLNYFHQKGRGLDGDLAKGLVAFLNSTLLDSYFRQFNGHTQVNATDLRNIKYPSMHQLKALGAKIADQFPTQQELDELIQKELLDMPVSDQNDHEKDPIVVKRRIEQTIQILKDLGLPRAQQNERSALTLLALLNLQPQMSWQQAESPLYGITPMMDFFKRYYGKDYKPNTRETVRRQTVHQFLDAGLIVANPDDPERPINSPNVVYQIEQGALELLRTHGTSEWEKNLRAYLSSVETLQKRYAQEREMLRIPVNVAPGRQILLSPGGQNVLVEKIIHDFGSLYTPGGKILYVGDTDTKFAYFDKEALEALGVTIEGHGKMPDVIIHHVKKDWLVLVEAVTSHGPIDAKRKKELDIIFRHSSAGLVFVTAFLTRAVMVDYLRDISWETDVWVAESPTHLIHFNGERFLGPYTTKVS